jgi:DNA polymerase (family 10)
VPPGLRCWLAIPGLGARKARALHLATGLATLEELEAAAREGRLRGIPGFGEKSEANILAGIERMRAHAGRFLQPVARAEARRLLELLAARPGVRRAEIAGSVRRRAVTSGDIDLLVSADEPAAVMEALCGAPGVTEIVARGSTRSSVRLAAGPGADLRVVAEASFPAALLYFTGSKAHNIALRGRAQRAGLRLNEYGLAREDDGTSLPCPDEAAIYRALGIGSWIPPELREDQGEIEAAEAGQLPVLIERSDLRGILHAHSSWSDGAASIETMAREARAMGFQYLGLTDHSRSAVWAHGLSLERVREQRAEVERINHDLDGSFRVLHGIEVDILADGTLDFPDDVLAGFELVVASVHGRFTLGEPEQTARFLRALESPWVDVIGHPTGRLLLQREGYALDLPRVFEAAAARGVAVELNCHPSRLDPDWADLRLGLRRGLRTCIAPDAHAPAGLYDVDYGIGVARKAWCTAEDALNAWPLPRLLEHLRRRRRRAGVLPGSA